MSHEDGAYCPSPGLSNIARPPSCGNIGRQPRKLRGRGEFCFGTGLQQLPAVKQARRAIEWFRPTPLACASGLCPMRQGRDGRLVSQGSAAGCPNGRFVAWRGRIGVKFLLGRHGNLPADDDARPPNLKVCELDDLLVGRTVSVR